ncbi:MAG: septum formation initiator family protein [Thermodesulfobacteriota bacterium]|nr:septum formation initiator family protein [Thermodesulfobacteriota bacterium]
MFVLCFSGVILAWLGFGERGLIHLYRTEMERQEYVDRIRQLADENEVLLEEVRRLRTDMEYVESVARKQLNLVKPNEVVYRFSNEKPYDDDIKTISTKFKHTNENGNSERMVADDGGIR